MTAAELEQELIALAENYYHEEKDMKREAILSAVEHFRYQAMCGEEEIKMDAFALSGELVKSITAWEQAIDTEEDEGEQEMAIDLASTRRLSNRLSTVIGILSDLHAALADL